MRVLATNKVAQKKVFPIKEGSLPLDRKFETKPVGK